MESKHLTEKQKRLISRGSVLALWACLGLASCALVAGLKLWHVFSAPGFEQYRYIGVAGLAFGTVAFVCTAVVLVRALNGPISPADSKVDADA